MNPNDEVFAVVDDPSVKPVFANRIVSVLLDRNGNIAVTLGDMRYVPEKLPSEGTTETFVCVTTRVVLSYQSATDLIQALSKPLAEMKAIAAAHNAPVPSRTN